MEPLVYVIAILGCGDAGAGCERARTMPTAYRTEIACRADQDAALIANSDLDYPVVVADCRAGPTGLATDTRPADRVLASR